MLNKKVEEALNAQINAEMWSAYLYLSMAAYCHAEGQPGMAKWFEVQFQEEQDHAKILFNYINSRNGRVERYVADFHLETKHDLSLAYTPGVAEPCLEIAQDREQVYRYTGKGNAVAIVTDGTAVLGLGDIGPEAALPVMEGKACLFKRFGGVDAYPICLNTKDPEEIVRAVQLIAPGFGGINLEDISAPRCFEIEERLIETLDIPVFHDDQHGTAVVVLAALINGAKCLGLELPQVQTVISGAGAAGISICKLLMKAGVRDITLCDRQGAIWEGREGLNGAKTAMAKVTNRAMRKGSLAEVMEGADLFIGVSGPGIVTQEMVRSMSPQAMVFALSNPVPEIMPELALAAGAKVVATGRSDFPNQINNLLVFPGIFKGALAARASRITEEMMIAAAYAIAGRVSPEELSRECIIPSTFDMGVADVVAEAVKVHVEH